VAQLSTVWDKVPEGRTFIYGSTRVFLQDIVGQVEGSWYPCTRCGPIIDEHNAEISCIPGCIRVAQHRVVRLLVVPEFEFTLEQL